MYTITLTIEYIKVKKQTSTSLKNFNLETQGNETVMHDSNLLEEVKFNPDPIPSNKI